MEEFHWGWKGYIWKRHIHYKIAILILMEDYLWSWCSHHKDVVIEGIFFLILMEDTLWDQTPLDSVQKAGGLNPYSNGRYSMRSAGRWKWMKIVGLNPYFNGRYSMREECWKVKFWIKRVLILILMEDTLWVWPARI